MATLGQFTSPQLVVPELRCRDAGGVAGELCSTLQRAGLVTELLPFYNAVVSRESLSSTAIAPGLALPHGRLAGLSQLCFALGRCPEPIPWFGGESVQLVFLFAVPDNGAATYLSLMSGLAKLSQDRARLKSLLQAGDARTMIQLLEQVPLRQPRPVAVAA